MGSTEFYRKDKIQNLEKKADKNFDTNSNFVLTPKNLQNIYINQNEITLVTFCMLLFTNAVSSREQTVP